jgi:dihydrofolate synthase/folylpolyglutamate synthase
MHGPGFLCSAAQERQRLFACIELNISEITLAKTDYQKCLDSMFRLQRFGIKLELETIRHFLEKIGNPQTSFKTIHIAGTNGKGSVAAMLSAILHRAGYTVGRYTSPHLVNFNERICIDDRPITDDDVIAAWQLVSSVAPANRQPTFFELTTAMALSEFGRRKVDWAVIETGMGGRMDATNVIQPELTIITNISMEHKAYLGNTIAAIAYEKAGIIKNGVPLVSGVRQKSAKDVILAKAHSMQAPAYLHKRDFRHRRKPGNRFNYKGIANSFRDLSLNLDGAHQFENAALAIAACEVLDQSRKAALAPSDIRYGLQHTHWPGRMEIAGHSPTIILDGAHNLMAASVLARHLTAKYVGKKIILIIGILDDKPYRAILKYLVPCCQIVIVTQADTQRAIAAEQLEIIAREYSSNVHMMPTVKQALHHALGISEQHDIICIAGSLYVVGEAKSALEKISLFT